MPILPIVSTSSRHHVGDCSGTVRPGMLGLLIVIFLIIHLPGLSTVPIPQARAGETVRHVLILHSYHQTFQWTDSVHQGVEEAFARSELPLELHVEYMDSKRHTVDKIFPHLNTLYKKKYADLQLDVILTSDDNALDFILLHGDETFPGVPVIFCGVNDFTQQRIEGKTAITGVAEAYDLAATFELILQTHPTVRHIAVITDATSSGEINLKRFLETSGQFADQVSFVALSKLSAAQLQEALAQLPDQTAVVNLSFFREPGGQTYTLKQGIELIVAHSPYPVYTTFDFMLSHGTLGGVVVSGAMQGRHAAMLAIRVLEGEAADQVPVITKSPNIPMFDYRVMGRFGLNIKDLPAGSVVLNEPESFYYRFKYLIWTTVFFITLQAIVIILLGFSMVQRRQAEQAHKLSEQQIRKVIEASPVGICIVRARKFAFVNSAYVKIFGYDHADEIVGRFVEELYAPEDRARMTRYALDRVAGRPVPTLYEIRGYRRDGTVFDAEARVTLIHYLGQPSSLGFVVDSSREKQLRKKLEQSNRLEAIGTLAGGIAHDFNNILTAIIGHAELASLESQGQQGVRDNLNQVIRAGGRARELVRQILTFSRSQDRASDYFQIALIIKEALQLVRASLPSTIAISTSIQSKAMMHGDPSHIHQMLMNLFANAGFAMQEHGGTLAVRLDEFDLVEGAYAEHAELLTGGYLRLVVSDTGPGIPETIRGKIYEPFFTTKATGEGSGMGLAQVHGIVKDHGGCIDAADNQPNGARFTILLPIKEAPAAADRAPEGTLHGGHERILLVDDEELVTEVTSRLLEKYGYQVTCCNDSREALARFTKDPLQFDLILTDMTMPYLTGDRLAVAMMQLRPDLPVVLCTGYSDRINEAQAFKLGLQAFIEKPLVKEQLLQTIRMVLDAPVSGRAIPG